MERRIWQVGDLERRIHLCSVTVSILTYYDTRTIFPLYSIYGGTFLSILVHVLKASDSPQLVPKYTMASALLEEIR